jgi:ATP-dependent Zn protease
MQRKHPGEAMTDAPGALLGEAIRAFSSRLSRYNDRPHQDIQNLTQLSDRLAGRPMSDVAWVVNEAARLAARAKKDAIDEIDLFTALKRLKA